MFQLSHPYITTGKTIHLTIWTFASEVMSVLFRMLSKFIIPLLPRSKFLLIACYHITPLYYCCIFFKSALQFSSVAQSCLTLWDLMNCSMPGLPVHHQLPEFTQTHVHQVSDVEFHSLYSVNLCPHDSVTIGSYIGSNIVDLLKKFRFLSSLEKLNNPLKHWFYFTARQKLMATQRAVLVQTNFSCLLIKKCHVSWTTGLALLLF